MADTPYAPPAAHVSDPVVAAGPRPRSVRLAALCLWLSAAIVAVMAAIGAAPMVMLFRSGAIPLVAVVTTVATIAFSLAVLAFVALKLRAGRGWVRWLFLALYVLGLVSIVFSLMTVSEVYAARSPLAAATELVQLVLQTAALAFMFARPSREWFAARRNS